MKTNQVFVFGSNRLGIHRRGAAKDAMNMYGAVYGVGEGMQGQSYAIPTKATPWKSLPLDDIQLHVERFLEYAKTHPDQLFYITRIGCGLAGYADKDIAPFFKDTPDNCELPVEWVLGPIERMEHDGPT